jgi:hypothetical protein
VSSTGIKCKKDVFWCVILRLTPVDRLDHIITPAASPTGRVTKMPNDIEGPGCMQRPGRVIDGSALCV